MAFLGPPPPGIDLHESKAADLIGAWSSTWGLAVLSVILRILCRRLARIRIWLDDWLIIASLILTSVFQCVPIYALWQQFDPVHPTDPSTFSCGVNIHKLFIGKTVSHIVTDVFILLFPLPYIWSLNLRMSQKIATACIFLVGIFVMIVSIVRFIFVLELDLESQDVTWDQCTEMMWTGVEVYVGTVCACLPSLKPLLNLILHGTVHPRSQASNESEAQIILEIAEATKRRCRHPSDANTSSSYIFASMRGAMDPHMFERLSESEAGSRLESARDIEMEDIGNNLKDSPLILTFGNYYSDKGWYELIEENYYATGEAYVFNIAYSEALSLADQGCQLFQWLVALRRDDTHSESYLRAYFAHNSREQMVLDWVDELDDHIDGGTLDRKLIICAEESELAAKEVTYRPPNLSPSSNETIATIKSWLQECFTSHGECQQFQGSNSTFSEASVLGPRRLLHLSGDASHPQVRLHQNSSSSSLLQYAALSYCWGGEQAVKLKDSLVQSWMKDMPYDGFPQTIKDAVRATMDLGLQYLWIDALCIIQDSDQDKAEQISRMAEIYEQAYVTISAARAVAAAEGFLHSRYIPGERGFRIPFTCEDGQPSAVIVWHGREPDAWEPIDKRSWCLQESILSPRVLEYGTHNIRWHCARSRADESQLQCDGWAGRSETFAQLNMSHPLTSSVDWIGLLADDKIVQVWQTLVSHYTRRGLGWYQDKLLAISAIARKINRISGEAYIAGLWAQHLGELLLWHPNHGPDAKEKPRRHASYVAPSWSWASFSGEIDFTFGSTMHLLEFVSAEVITQIPHDEFSAVVSGRVNLKTLTYRARIRKGPYGWSLWDEQTHEEVEGSLMFDVVEDAIDGEVVSDEEVLLALIMSQDALLLKSHSGGAYTRIGIYREGQREANRPAWQMGQVTII
ncbi:het-domain-containing [Trichoderma arundinaceum]|uniref:Het-domain-containing n=1 Tax=Trichoderma arundinaceum TaxID=490622 RepID=A0A395NKY0_TRIAR|nr:het-domain-containing [Trichoderma arundinaceum]